MYFLFLDSENLALSHGVDCCCYHVIEEVDRPVERLTDACDVLKPLETTVVLIDDIAGKASCGDGITSQHTHGHQDLKHSLHAVREKYCII